jgi:deoxyribodipyrimidine photo-lyase
MRRALVWFRRDLRLADNPALHAALDAGFAPIPVYVHAPEEEAPWAPGAASRAWLHRSLSALDASLQALGSGLVVRGGASLPTLVALAAETGADAVFFNRLYEPVVLARDKAVEQGLRAAGLHVASANAALLAELAPDPAPSTLPPLPGGLPRGSVPALGLQPRRRWDRAFWEEWEPGEAGATEMLDAFLEGAARGYKEQRNLPDRIGTSKLSPHLHFGEVSPRQVAARFLETQRPPIPEGDRTSYLAELGWREFSQHLLFHFPHMPQADMDDRFSGFAWRNVDAAQLAAWQQGRTGVPLVDAGMRELWHTGWMHNRVRMVVASYLTRNLRFHWRHGAAWFWDTLVDADLGNNTQGWQWSAGTGADAAPYFRIFSPTAQAERFDPHGRYIRRWVPELAGLPVPALFAPWEHPDLVRRLAPGYPAQPVADPKQSRAEALDAYRVLRGG